MATRIAVPGPEQMEEARQLAEAVADLYYVMSLLVENATYLIPGESVEELFLAWDKSKGSMEYLVEKLISTLRPTQPTGLFSADLPGFEYATLEKSQLTGEVGKLKRSTLGRLKDRVLMFFNSEPRTDEKWLKASDAAASYLEYGSTVVSTLPGYEEVVEILSLGKQLLGIRAKRGI